MPQSLPIDALLPEVAAHLRRAPNLVIEAPPGAGKTTRVPSLLLDEEITRGREVWVLEPRRMAARLAARRVAEERGETVGETIGYQVRFEDVSGPRTRLRFLTEGVFTRHLLSDPQLERVGAVILDEFHERHLQADLALALLKRLQQSARTDLRIIAMSATLEAAPIAKFLGDVPILRSEGRRFDVRIEHLERPDERPLGNQVESAVRRLVKEERDGDLLVFLPGAGEIRRAQAALESLAAEFDLLVLPLHGELPLAEQDRAVRPAEKCKVILSTNVAESSVTIEGIVAVVDSGLARVAGHSSWSGLPTLAVTRISRAPAVQRAGRAGRTRPGRALRLYTAQDFAARPEHEMPEIERADLSEAALELHAAGIRDLHNFEWFEAPPRHALDAAETLLERLGALDETHRITDLGQRMLRLPLHPRLARLVIEAERRGVLREACVIAALISERDIRRRDIFTKSDARVSARQSQKHSPSDLLELLDLFTEAARARFAPEKLSRMNLDANAVRRVERVRKQIARLIERSETGSDAAMRDNASGTLDKDSELMISILAGYPDRVARRRNFGRKLEGETCGASLELLLAGGGSAALAAESVVRNSEFLVALDAEERREAGKRGARASGAILVRLASAVEPEWLIELFAERISETKEIVWNAQSERVEVVERLMYDSLVIDESRAQSVAVAAEAARVLSEAALAAGIESFVDAEQVNRFLARVEFMRKHFPEEQFPALDEDAVRAALIKLCESRRSFAELREAVQRGELIEILRGRLTAEQARLLARMTPERVRLMRGREVRVNYERERQPWIASRLQDFFGMKDGPKIADGRVALVLHLLAPSQRPIQLTSDLAGFWSRHYAEVRRELSRRYPRHAWPQDPFTADEKSEKR